MLKPRFEKMKETYEWNPTGFVVILITCVALPIAGLLIYLAGLIYGIWPWSVFIEFLAIIGVIAGLGLVVETQTRPQPRSCLNCGAEIGSEAHTKGRCQNCGAPIWPEKPNPCCDGGKGCNCPDHCPSNK